MPVSLIIAVQVHRDSLFASVNSESESVGPGAGDTPAGHWQLEIMMIRLL
jgi:hypothetical protein